MDFKVTGTEDGITACQMDIKIKGLKHDILIEALNQAKEGRLEILKKLNDDTTNLSHPTQEDGLTKDENEAVSTILHLHD